MANMFQQGAGANFGPLGRNSAASGTGNLPASSYAGPINVGEVAYRAGAGATQANPWGGDAGIRPYNTGISNSAAAAWQPTVYSNTMGGGAANPNTASSAGYGRYGNTITAGKTGIDSNDLASYYASKMSGSGDPSADPGVSQYGAGLSSPAMPNSNYGSKNIAPDPGPGSSAWDFQNNAYRILYGQGGKPSALVGSGWGNDLGNNNLNRYASTFQQGFGNRNAGEAMRGVTGAESAGGNPFAINYGPGPSGSGALGMNQLMKDRLTNYVNSGGGSFNYSPESQASNAVSEIYGSSRYSPTANSLNNLGSNINQMRSALIGNYEGLDPNKYADQYAADVRNAAKYGTTLNTNPLGRGN